MLKKEIGWFLCLELEDNTIIYEYHPQNISGTLCYWKGNKQVTASGENYLEELIKFYKIHGKLNRNVINASYGRAFVEKSK